MPCPVGDCNDTPEHPYGFIVEGTDGTRFSSEGHMCQVHAQQVLMFFNAGREAPISKIARLAEPIFTEAMNDPNTNEVVVSINKRKHGL